MIIEIDYNPSPKESFFISIQLNQKESISFDYTTKRKGIIKQVLVERKEQPKDAKIDEQWETLVLNNRKFLEKYKVNWIDQGERDWCNDEIFELVWEKPLSDELAKTLLYYSRLISDNYTQLERFPKELKDFEKLLKNEISKHI